MNDARQVRTVAQRSPDAIRAAKRLCNHAQRSLDESAGALLRAESAEQHALMASANQIEALRANLEKRPPRFQD